MTPEERLARVREIGERLKAIRATEGPDHPLAGARFELAKLIGEAERDFMDMVEGRARREEKP